jgi:putative transposase
MPRLRLPTPMPSPPQLPRKPGYAALRRYRWSASGAEYFVTIKAQRPAIQLSSPGVLAALSLECSRLETQSIWSLRCWVVMPDHMHFVFSLGENITLADCLRRFKGRTAPMLNRANMKWQPGYYDHRLREDDDRLPIFLYIFLNPYRANLLHAAEKWCGYWCATDDWQWFGAMTNEAAPFPEWLG